MASASPCTHPVPGVLPSLCLQQLPCLQTWPLGHANCACRSCPARAWAGLQGVPCLQVGGIEQLLELAETGAGLHTESAQSSGAVAIYHGDDEQPEVRESHTHVALACIVSWDTLSRPAACCSAEYHSPPLHCLSLPLAAFLVQGTPRLDLASWAACLMQKVNIAW